MAGPLTGVRILDCSRLMPFSYGTQLLAEAGATVVKVEAPGGEYGRGMSEVFALTNRGKRSITLNLRTERGRALLLELAARYDAILESFRPGFLVSLGLGYETLQTVAPGLVYCSATGYGQTGPIATRPGHDLNYAALAVCSRRMAATPSSHRCPSSTRSPDGPPRTRSLSVCWRPGPPATGAISMSAWATWRSR